MIVDRSHSSFDGRTIPMTPAVIADARRGRFLFLSLPLFHSSVHYHQVFIIIKHSFFQHFFFMRISQNWAFDIISWLDHSRHLRPIWTRRPTDETTNQPTDQSSVADVTGQTKLSQS
jgi:hypothetical protein